MSAALIISLLMLGTPVQSAQDSVSAQRIEKLETRVEELEARVTQHEIAEGYFDSIIANERTLWTVLVTLIIASVGGFTYYKFHERVRDVTDDFDGMRERLDEIESEFYKARASLYKRYAITNREENPLKAFRDQIDAANSLRKSESISEVDKETLRKDLEMAARDLERSQEFGYMSVEFYKEYDQKISKISDFLGKEFDGIILSIKENLTGIDIREEENT